MLFILYINNLLLINTLTNLTHFEQVIFLYNDTREHAFYSEIKDIITGGVERMEFLRFSRKSRTPVALAYRTACIQINI